jgi:hypothetical protein
MPAIAAIAANVLLLINACHCLIFAIALLNACHRLPLVASLREAVAAQCMPVLDACRGTAHCLPSLPALLIAAIADCLPSLPALLNAAIAATVALLIACHCVLVASLREAVAAQCMPTA